ncbi:uncharacterized protein LOC110046484 [Paramuricea clavata]|uniref:Uncharacterized protein LOC110046484 n=1 Tax=Paramuricea clavata TaxID=317549 RepID=A0A6S7GAL3_PARCT|nr:uncharacterized protein LOC110046484 [Paramuricea clavata]
MDQFAGKEIKFVSDWLKENNLEKLVDIFEDNKIDGGAFALLTNEAMNAMIQKQGLLLKFKQKYGRIVNQNTIHSALTQSSSSLEDPHESSSQPLIASGKPGISPDVLMEQSKIYGRFKDQQKISSWQKVVNDAAFSIARETPDKLYDRAQLKLSAEKLAHSSYVFKQKSGSQSQFESQYDTPKRTKISATEREKKIETYISEIESMNTKIRQQKDLDKANFSKDFNLCAKFNSDQRKTMRDL